MRTTGPTVSAEGATAELLDILTLLERPARTIPENQDEEEDDKVEEEEVREGFIASRL